MVWNTVSPRLGLTLALDQSRKTVARVSGALYRGQMPNSEASWNNPLGNAYVEYDWRDANGDDTVQAGEVDYSRLRSFLGIDPSDPDAPRVHRTPSTPTTTPTRTTRWSPASIARSCPTSRRASPTPSASPPTSRRRSCCWGYYWYPWVGVTRRRLRARGGLLPERVLHDAVRPERRRVRPARGHAGAVLTNRQDYSPDLPRPGAEPGQAAVEQLDGPGGLLLERLQAGLQRGRDPGEGAVARRGGSVPPSPARAQRQSDTDRAQLADHDYVAAQSGGSGRQTFYTSPDLAGLRERAGRAARGSWSCRGRCSAARARSHPSSSGHRRHRRHPQRAGHAEGRRRCATTACGTSTCDWRRTIKVGPDSGHPQRRGVQRLQQRHGPPALPSGQLGRLPAYRRDPEPPHCLLRRPLHLLAGGPDRRPGPLRTAAGPVDGPGSTHPAPGVTVPPGPLSVHHNRRITRCSRLTPLAALLVLAPGAASGFAPASARPPARKRRWPGDDRYPARRPRGRLRPRDGRTATTSTAWPARASCSRTRWSRCPRTGPRTPASSPAAPRTSTGSATTTRAAGAPFPTMARSSRTPAGTRPPSVGAYPVSRPSGLDRGFAVYDDPFAAGDDTTREARTERRAQEVVDRALAWLASRAPSRSSPGSTSSIPTRRTSRPSLTGRASRTPTTARWPTPTRSWGGSSPGSTRRRPRRGPWSSSSPTTARASGARRGRARLFVYDSTLKVPLAFLRGPAACRLLRGRARAVPAASTSSPRSSISSRSRPRPRAGPRGPPP